MVVEPVQAAIWHCLNHYAFSDATFLAERLLAESESEEALFLVATCYYRQGKVDQAHHVLSTEGATTPSTKFLLAKCASDLKRDAEAESILRGQHVDPRKEVNLEETVAMFGDRAAFALQILSTIYNRSERGNKAAEADRKALKLNPFLWQSFESLCSAGEVSDPPSIWDPDMVDTLAHCTGSNPVMNLLNSSSVTHPPPNPTPVRAGRPHVPVSDKQQFQTPVSLSSIPVINVSESMAHSTPQCMETPLLYCNSISSTPLPLGSSPAPLSGISSLNLTTDSDISQSQHKLPSFMPPPLRPKQKRLGPRHLVAQANSVGSFSPSFGLLCQTPSPAGVAAKLLEFSSPQVVLLSPYPQTPSPSPVMQLKSTLSSTPGIPPLRASTPGAPLPPEDAVRPIKRVAMAAKPDNTVQQQVLAPSVQSHTANMITPSPVSLPPRRSSRLFGSTQSVKENSKGPGKGRLKSKSRILKADKQMSENELNEKNSRDSMKPDREKISTILESDLKPVCPPTKHTGSFNSTSLTAEASRMQKSSVTGLLLLLKQVGLAYQKIGHYNCKEAVRLLQLLPPKHATSTWVLALLGKCHFELAEYREAVKYFAQVRERDPFRLDMLEYYSTALWHLQEEVALSALAQDLQKIDKLSPATWCAAGNCFSHQKEHENAIKFFQRAVQVSPNFAYAYTLLGHEYVLVEELEKALSCFRTAVRLDHRHYNAWYGIGLTYYKQERFQLAEIYYRKALAINRFSPILMCHVAVVQHATNNTNAALDTLNAAISVSPKNPLCKFERASILHSSERYQEALEELLELKQIVPKESPVYFLIGKVHNKLGNTHLALMHFSWAMDLDPKGANSQIKDALDPALNRQSQEIGSVGQEQEESMVADETDQHHEDFQGEISEGFNPTMGENSEAVSSPAQSPNRGRGGGGGGRGEGGALPLLLNDSDDSL